MEVEPDNYFCRRINQSIGVTYDTDLPFRNTESWSEAIANQSLFDYHNESITIDLEGDDADVSRGSATQFSDLETAKNKPFNDLVDKSSSNKTETIYPNIDDKSKVHNGTETTNYAVPKIKSYQHDITANKFSRSCCVSAAKTHAQNLPIITPCNQICEKSNLDKSCCTSKNNRNACKEFSDLNEALPKSYVCCEFCQKIFRSAKSRQIHNGKMHKTMTWQDYSACSEGEQSNQLHDDAILKDAYTSNSKYPPIKLSLTKVGSIKKNTYKAVPIEGSQKLKRIYKRRKLAPGKIDIPDDEAIRLLETAHSTITEIKKLPISEALPFLSRLQKTILCMTSADFALFIKALLEPCSDSDCFTVSSRLSFDSQSSSEASIPAFQESSVRTREPFVDCNSNTENEHLSHGVAKYTINRHDSMQCQKTK